MPQTGDKILASSIDSLFNRLEEIRVAHNNNLQTPEVQQILSQPFNTESVKDKRVSVPDVIPLMKQYINILKNSVFLTAITDEQVNEIVVPNVGDLIKYEEFGDIDQLVTLVETYPAEYTTNFSGFNGNNFSFKGSNFTNFSFNGSNFTNFSFNGSDFTNFSFNGSDFTNFNFSSSPVTPHTNQRFDGRFFSN